MALYSLNVGGSEKLGIDLIRSFIDSNYKVVCCATRKAEGPLAETLREWNVPHLALALEARTRIGRIFGKRRLRKWLIEQRVDCIHAHHFSVYSDVHRAARTAGIAIQIVTEHTADVVVNEPKYRKVVALLAPKASHIVAINDGVRNAICEVAGASNVSISVIENGIDTNRFSPADNSRHGVEVSVIWLGRLHPDKDILTGLRAFQVALGRTDVPLHLRVVGGGEDEHLAKDFVAKNGLGQQVTFVGEVRDVVEWLKKSDIFFMSSRTEGTPLALLEAMSCGLPTVATSVGGIPGTVSNASADLSPAGDVEGLGAALANLAESTGTREAMGIAAREIVVRNYSDKLMIEKYLHLLGKSED